MRIHNLGVLSLFVDEGVEGLAVKSILHHGVPIMDSGLIYLRFPLYLYLQAVFTYVFHLNEFWLRIPSVIFGVASIIPTYILGKALFNRRVGALAATIIAFSGWEVELSRYARPYIALQFFFLIAVICLYYGFMRDKRKYRIWFLVAAFCTFLTHDLSQVLVVVFAIPLLFPGFSRTKKINYSFWGLGLLGLLLIQLKLVGIHLPTGMSFASSSLSNSLNIFDRVTNLLGIPAINGPDMIYYSSVATRFPLVLLILFFVIGSTTIYIFYKFFKKDYKGRILLGLTIIWSAFFYQFGLVLILIIIYVTVYARNYQIFRDPILRIVSIASLLCFLIWFVILAISSSLLLIQIPPVLFGFPNIYQYLIRWLVKGWPVITTGLTAGSIFLYLMFLKDRENAAAFFMLGALYIPALFASLFTSGDVPVYTLHLYPLIILIFSFAVWKIGGYIGNYFTIHNRYLKISYSSLGIIAILLSSPDTNPFSTQKIIQGTYQGEKNQFRNIITWPYYSDYQPDLKSPSVYVKKHMTKQDVVAVMGHDYNLQIACYYIGDIKYAITSKLKTTSFGVVKEGHLFHYVTKSKFITNAMELNELIQDFRGRLWIIGDRRILIKKNSYLPDEEIKKIVRKLTKEPDYIGHDGITFAVKIN